MEGGGAYFCSPGGGKHVSYSLDELGAFPGSSIGVLEARAAWRVVRALAWYFGPCEARVFTDSATTYFGLLRGSSRSPETDLVVKATLRLAREYGIRVLPFWIPSGQNPSDWGSRNWGETSEAAAIRCMR